jgi:hypothetical protein
LATTKFVGMANDSPLCTANTYGEAFEGVRKMAQKLGWLDPHIETVVRIWIEEVPHIGEDLNG